MGLKIEAFGFNAKGLGQEMLECKESTGLRDEGLVVSHAGKFSYTFFFLLDEANEEKLRSWDDIRCYEAGSASDCCSK